MRLPERDLYIGMNKTEKVRAIELEAMRRNGEIREWGFEKITLKLADDCRYNQDFSIVDNDGYLRFDETKGHWREDAKVKIRFAASQFPCKFAALRLVGGAWQREEFGAP